MLIFDIETDGLYPTATKVHVICIYDTAHPELGIERYENKQVKEGLDKLYEADEICGHNIINFDIPVLEKLFNVTFPDKSLIDTLIWSKLVFSDIFVTDMARVKSGNLPSRLTGSHSLRAYGYRLGVLKGDFGVDDKEAWAEWSQEMSDYCAQDVEVTKALVNKLQSYPDFKDALKLEFGVAKILERQERYGVLFDSVEAEKLYVKLNNTNRDIKEKLTKIFPAWFQSKGVFIPKRDNKRLGYVEGCSLTKIELTYFNPASRQHIARVLQKKYDWKPLEYTPDGQPKVDETVLSKLDYPEAKLLTEYLLVNKRLGQLADGENGWLRLIAKDGRIHGRVDTLGAVTGRMTHSKPNLAQVPAVYSPYGSECRSLFIAPKGKSLVGCDASALEARCLSHYLAIYDKGEYAKTVIEGKKEEGTDIHTVNMKALGISDRDKAKTWFYAWLYGSGDENLASILECSKKRASASRMRFLQRLPALKKLKEDIDNTIRNRGYLIGLDGRHLKVRSSHSALNVLLQSAGALIMKQALVLLDAELKKNYKGLYEFILNVHDEWQIECDSSIATTVGVLSVESIKKAGEHFKFRCPLGGEYKVGESWSRTH